MSRLVPLVLAMAFVACGNPSKRASECGDGVVDADEACDGSAGCTAQCTFACTDPTVDCGTGPVCQVATCTEDHACIFVVDTNMNGTSCGTGMVCNNGTCESEGTCGNGVLEGSEQCDFGMNDNGANAGCEEGCTLSCGSAADCDDMELCNGAETCDAVTINGMLGHRCVDGAAEDDGTACGGGFICNNEVCAAGTCGDSFTTAPEECDDANPTAGDGCENDCAYSCVSTDVTRNCTPTDPCEGQGTCNDSDHTCTPGTPLPNDTLCGGGKYCKTSVCTQPICPNSDPEPGETCDDGNMNNGDGCDNDCTYSCVTPATDCGTPPACQMWTCTGSHTCQSVADTSMNTMPCGTSGETCQNGACTDGVCGNGVVEGGEECDFGAASNGPNTGCETNCTFSCDTAIDCDDGNACDGTEACSSVTVNTVLGKRCTAGSPLTDNSTCGTGKICKSQSCVSSVCGDSYVDASVGETCEPPGTQTCDAACNIKICGNGVRSLDEQCDDGNTTNVDGCSATCKFEQSHRVIDLDLRFDTSTYCPANKLGDAVRAQLAKDMVTNAIDAGVADGSITIIFHLLGLDDLTGTSDPAVTVGIVGATPVAGTGYNGNADLDWWYLVDPLDLSGARAPLTTVSGAIASKELNTTAGEFAITVNFVGVDVTMDMFKTTIRAPIGAATTPLTSSGSTPGHLASEHLDPALQSFQTMGSSTVPAELCGATTARSLDNTNIPSAVVAYCSNYTIGHSLLDLYIGGCTYFFLPIIRSTQPDTSKTSNVTYTFQANAQRYVNGCKKFVGGVEQNPAPSLDVCLDNAGYSSYYKLFTDRIIGK